MDYTAPQTAPDHTVSQLHLVEDGDEEGLNDDREPSTGD